MQLDNTAFCSNRIVIQILIRAYNPTTHLILSDYRFKKYSDVFINKCNTMNKSNLTSKICVRLDDYTFKQMKLLCNTLDIKLSYLVRGVIDKILKNQVEANNNNN